MDLGYVLYENELKRSFWSTKTEYRRFLQLAVFKLILSKRYKPGTKLAVVMVKTKLLF